MRTASRLAVLAAFLAMTAMGCASVQRDWRGHPVSELIARFGPATRIAPYPFGGRVYVWETRVADSRPFGVEPAAHSRSRGRALVSRQTAVVDDAGIVTATHVETAVAP